MVFSEKNRVKGRSHWLAAVIVFLFLAATSTEGLCDTSSEQAECSKIEDNGERLECYDQFVRRKPKKPAPALMSEEKPSPTQARKPSYFSRLWELDPETRIDRFPITPYRSNYILHYTYNSSPNYAAVREADPGEDLKYEEVVFQLSKRDAFVRCVDELRAL